MMAVVALRHEIGKCPSVTQVLKMRSINSLMKGKMSLMSSLGIESWPLACLLGKCKTTLLSLWMGMGTASRRGSREKLLETGMSERSAIDWEIHVDVPLNKSSACSSFSVAKILSARYNGATVSHLLVCSIHGERAGKGPSKSFIRRFVCLHIHTQDHTSAHRGCFCGFLTVSYSKASCTALSGCRATSTTRSHAIPWDPMPDWQNWRPGLPACIFVRWLTSQK